MPLHPCYPRDRLVFTPRVVCLCPVFAVERDAQVMVFLASRFCCWLRIHFWFHYVSRPAFFQCLVRRFTPHTMFVFVQDDAAAFHQLQAQKHSAHAMEGVHFLCGPDADFLLFSRPASTPRAGVCYPSCAPPLQTFMYKALNTFVDDLFAFIIRMPTMHRLSCLRDDLVFLVYLYQRWQYGVDTTRANEYGQVSEANTDANGSGGVGE